MAEIRIFFFGQQKVAGPACMQEFIKNKGGNASEFSHNLVPNPEELPFTPGKVSDASRPRLKNNRRADR